MSAPAVKLIQASIQEQMEQAVESVNENQPTAARVHFLECAALCEQLDLQKQISQQPAPKQVTLDIP
jgi:hypothetical protein